MKAFADFGIEIGSQAGPEVHTTCPQCSSSRKKKMARCLSANVEKGLWHCNHCGWSGSLLKGAEKPNFLHWQKPRYTKPEKAPITTLPEHVVNWFKGRGISEEVLAANKIGFGKVYMPQIEDFANVVQFPYFRNGELINIKHRSGDKHFRLEAGAERIFYGLDDLDEVGIIVEGEIDKLSLNEAGFWSVVSVPDGAPAENTKDYSSKFEFIEADKEKIQAVKEWIVAVDSDKPGQRLEDELARRLGREKCKRVIWPQDCKDANETLTKHGKEKVISCIQEAKDFPVAGVFEVSDMSDKILHLYENGWEKGISTGYRDLDNHYSIRPGEFTVITGIPNSGKSNFLDQLLINSALYHGWRVAVFSPENQPIEDHAARMIEKFHGLPFGEGPTKRMTKEQLAEGQQWLNEHFFWILPDDDSEWSLNEILERAKSLVFKKGVRALVIDPWNELEHLRPREMSETEYISHSLKRLRQFGRHYGVAMFVVAHPAKLYKGSDGNYPVPTPYDISGSAHWRNKADNCLTIWRDFTKTGGEIEVHIQKIRFKQTGKIGMVDLIYDKVTGGYHD